MDIDHIFIFTDTNGKIANEAIDVLEKAIVYDPLSPLLNATLAYKYFNAHRYQEAIRLSDKLLELDPHMRNALEIKGYCLRMQGEWDKAIQLFEEYHRLANHPLKGLAPLGYAYAKTGQIEKALVIITKMEQRLAGSQNQHLKGIWQGSGELLGIWIKHFTTFFRR